LPKEVHVNGIPDYLDAWIVTQRWYAGKGRAPQFEDIGGFELDDVADGTHGQVAIRVHLILDHAANPVLYQVPLTERRTPLPGGESALVATRVDESGSTFIYDGPCDPAYATALLRLVLDEREVQDPRTSGRLAARGHRYPDGDGLEVVSSRVLGGEQSNTSIVYETVLRGDGPGSPVICKLFRALHDGDNPDVVLTEALGTAGSTVAPRVIGHLTGQWRDSGRPHGLATGHLAFAEEFLPGVEDAWRVALRAADVGEDFTGPSRALGETTAEMHRTLASALPSRATTPADIVQIVSNMRERFEMAAAQVPSLAVYRGALREVYVRAASSPWPPLQRIHGDFHLGQVLAVPHRGWVVLDFEGEPLRPMTERSLPDIPLRDVAGMLRSFDYVAGSIALTQPGRSVSEWALACRRAFLDGYIERSGRDVRAHRAVLDAFEIDKALYEAVYEARNRPAWLSIPRDAITRLVERVAQS
jgi:predicted trehalose synthase